MFQDIHICQFLFNFFENFDGCNYGDDILTVHHQIVDGLLITSDSEKYLQ